MDNQEKASLGYRLAKLGLSDDEIMKRARIELAEIVVIRALIAAEPSPAPRRILRTPF